mmetsp:Transcript_23087/g.35753  ORF Transcript_23087/g.35753 Transcript_23087/m.35753 type:complete len:245 (+) Transcript_23087:721-1455(+)
MKWYHDLMLKLFTDPKLADSVTGIPLQICDVLVQEMNKVDSKATLDIIAGMLAPYLSALGVMESKELKERVVEKIFSPLMETNKTKLAESSDDEEEMEKKEKHHRLVDGGKMPPKTVKEINEMINRKYEFTGFNNLIYAQNYVLKLAASDDKSKVLEGNRDNLYKLYDFALSLEPKPEREELTFSQMQLANKARSFVTLKMKKRQVLRKQKQDQKDLVKMKKALVEQLSQKKAEVDAQMEEPEK